MSPTPVKFRHTSRNYRSVSGGHSHKVAARAPGTDSVPHWGNGEWGSQADDGLYHPGSSHKSDDGQYHSNKDRTTDQGQTSQQQQQTQQQQAVAQQQQQSQSQQGQSSSGQSGSYGQSQQGSQAGSSGQSSGSQGQSSSGQSGSYGQGQSAGSQAGSSGQGVGSQGQSSSGQSGSSGQSAGSQAGSSGQSAGSQGQSSSGQSGSYGQSAGSQGQSSSGQAGTSGQSQQGSQAASNGQAQQAQQPAAQAQSQQNAASNAQSQQAQAPANANTQDVAPQAHQQSQNGQSSNNGAANMAALTAAQQQQAAAEAEARQNAQSNHNGNNDNNLNDPSNVHNKPSNNMDDDDDMDDRDMSDAPHRHNHDHNYDPTSTKSLPSPSPTDGAGGSNAQSWHTAATVLSVFFALAVVGGLIAAWIWRRKRQEKKTGPRVEKIQDAFQNGMSNTKRRASNIYASFLGTAAGTSAGALGAVRNSLRDPLPYMSRPARQNSRIGFADPIHEVSSSGSSSHSRHYDTSRSGSVSDEKRHVNYSTPTLVVSPTEQQQHPAKAREHDTPTVRHVPSGRPELQRSNSLDARIGMATSPESEMDQAERAAENNPPTNNSTGNLSAPRPGQNLLAITSMVPSTTSIYRVEIGFTAKKVGQMDLREGQAVTIRQSFDDGWVSIYSPSSKLLENYTNESQVLCSIADSGREGLAPRACLSAWPVRSNTGAQNPDRVRSPEPVSSPGTPRFYSHFFSTRSVS